MKRHSALAIHKKVFEPSTHVHIEYPEIIGFEDATVELTTNQKIKKLFLGDRISIEEPIESADEEDFFTYECTYSTQTSKDSITLTMQSYYYESDMPHGYPSKSVFHIDAQTGEFYYLKDLFKKESDLEIVRQILQTQFEARRDELGDLVEEIPPLSSDQNFLLFKEGLEIYFQPYEIACYACGFPSFIIPLAELLDILNYESKLLSD